MLTIKQAARAGRCSKSSILNLIKAGKVKATKQGTTLAVEMTREQVAKAVEASLPKHGWRKKASRERTGLASGLTELTELMRLSREQRKVLLALAKRFNVAELRLLLTL